MCRWWGRLSGFLLRALKCHHRPLLSQT
jgi:hypothetical protein